MTGEYRLAVPEDHQAITEVIAAGFDCDPLWGPALSRCGGATEFTREFWGIFVEGALRFPTVSIAGDVDAVTLWLPPGADEMTDEQEARTFALVERELPESAADVRELFACFERARPRDEPHYYLSLFATKPACRGQGIGMALLRDDLARIDADGACAYLESTNQANNSRYAVAGFVSCGQFEHPTTGASVTTMWRPAQRRPTRE
jgi:GNAT superfamily N-acetyltransferase